MTMSKPALSKVVVTGALPGYRFGEVPRPTGETRTVEIEVRIWPGRPLTARRVADIVCHEHKLVLLSESLSWAVVS